jgi:hypothetical protein
MSATVETVERPGAELEEPAGRDAASAAANTPFSHLHFDRRARAWRGPTEIFGETSTGTEELVTNELRSA